MYISKLATIISFIALSTAITVTYSGLYDDDTVSLTELACWKGGRVVEDQDWEKLGEVTYQIAGYGGVDGPDSPLCGTCWSLSYGDTSRSVLVLNSAQAGSGFETSFTVMNSLTGGNAERLGRANITAFQTGLLDCGVATEPTEEERKMVVGGNWYSNWFYNNFT
ncbi:Protein SnodProt1 [Fusarium oxysporum f. sp. cubense]|uniref:Protein SnodProt1 n=1 Tax=Fusarium oxysporum f. sp. cubense TaxID=61366 RepID=A0A559LJL6_FUSOC|nr:Protein SnodProt1 [Fusarium oxysporum f. sp. cubense]